MFSAKISVKPRYNEPVRSVRLGQGCVELPYGSILGGEVGPSFPRKQIKTLINNKNGRASTAPSKRSDSVIRYNDPVSNVLAGK